MARPIGLGAEVLGGFDDSMAHELFPHAVDPNASRQGVLGASDPACESEPIVGLIGWHGRERFG